MITDHQAWLFFFLVPQPITIGVFSNGLTQKNYFLGQIKASRTAQNIIKRHFSLFNDIYYCYVANLYVRLVLNSNFKAQAVFL